MPRIVIDENLDLMFTEGGEKYLDMISLFSYEWKNRARIPNWDLTGWSRSPNSLGMCLRVNVRTDAGDVRVDVVFHEDVYGTTSPADVFGRARDRYRRR